MKKLCTKLKIEVIKKKIIPRIDLVVFMVSIFLERKLWMTKLSLIHQIKFGYGPGTGNPGPVDDWLAKKAKKIIEKNIYAF